MEDSNILDHIISNKMDEINFRIYHGIPIWRFKKLNNKSIDKIAKVTVLCNYQDPLDKPSHLILQFFE